MGGGGAAAPDLLDLLGVFVADKDDDGVDVDAVEPFDGVRCDVQQTVAALRADGDSFRFQSRRLVSA